MVFAEIESQLRTEGGWNMHIAIALIMALLVTAGVLWFFFAPRKAYRAPLRDGVQEAVVEVKGGYNPAVIEAEAGMPLRLIFDRKEDGECSSHVVFSDFGVDLALPAFRTTTLTLASRPAGRVSLRMRYEHAARHVAHTAGKACKCRCRRRFRGWFRRRQYVRFRRFGHSRDC